MSIKLVLFYKNKKLHIYIKTRNKMKTIPMDKISIKKNGYQSDDDNIRYKINKNFNNVNKTPSKLKKNDKVSSDDDNIRYKLPAALTKSKYTEQKQKSKPRIKVNFWSNKQSGSRLHSTEHGKANPRKTVAIVETEDNKQKNSGVKLRKRVSFLPSPLFSDNHVPMVTVPDDLTIHLNEEEANDLGEDLNLAFVNSDSSANDNKSNDSPKRKSRSSIAQINPKGTKRKWNTEDSDSRIQANENELEFFSKYIVQKLRKMETNQRIYSENLINTVLMMGQLGKLNVKSKIAEV